MADRGPLQRGSAAESGGTSRGSGKDICRANRALARHLAVHCWLVIKERDAPRYTRYDYTAWGEPIRVNGFAADGRWFGGMPHTVAAADGALAERMIPKIRSAVEGYRLRNFGDYRAWPGPNSNTFVAAVLAAIPELQVTLPPTAIGKDFPHDGDVFGLTASRTGLRLTLGELSGTDHRLGRRAGG